jgi:hypothetical protein
MSCPVDDQNGLNVRPARHRFRNCPGARPAAMVVGQVRQGRQGGRAGSRAGATRDGGTLRRLAGERETRQMGGTMGDGDPASGVRASDAERDATPSG